MMEKNISKHPTLEYNTQKKSIKQLSKEFDETFYHYANFDER